MWEEPSALHLDREKVEFAEIEARDRPRIETADLPDQLGPDRAAGARDQDTLASQVAVDLFVIEVDFLPAEEVFQGHLPARRHGDLAVDELPEARHRAEPFARFFAQRDDSPHLDALGGRQGDQDFIV